MRHAGGPVYRQKVDRYLHYCDIVTFIVHVSRVLSSPGDNVETVTSSRFINKSCIMQQIIARYGYMRKTKLCFWLVWYFLFKKNLQRNIEFCFRANSYIVILPLYRAVREGRIDMPSSYICKVQKSRENILPQNTYFERSSKSHFIRNWVNSQCVVSCLCRFADSYMPPVIAYAMFAIRQIWD